MEGEYYDTAQICLNGHMVNFYSDSQPGSNQKFCSDCGAPTIRQCPNCETKIRSFKHIPGVVYFPKQEAKKYCFNCGKPFPWTEEIIKNAKEFADELDLDTEEKGELKENVENLINDKNIEVSGMKIKRILKNAGSTAAEGLKTIVVNVLSEAAKKAVGF